MGLRIPPGWHRRFAFEKWPAFRRRQWQHLRKEAEQGFADPETVRIFAGDRDPAALFSLRGCLRSLGLSRSVALFAGDFFDLRPQRMAAGPGLVVLNPPYGRRLKAAAGRADADALFSHLARVYCGWKASVVLPTEQIGRIPFPHKKRRLVHGGLKLIVVTGRIPPGR
jgi:23S rRNA G2445 N2-methylase RlmL